MSISTRAGDAFNRRGVVKIGIYGKVGMVKGSFDLLAALARLQRRVGRFS